MRNTKKSKLKKEQNKKVKEELVTIDSGAIRVIKNQRSEIQSDWMRIFCYL